MTRAAAHGATLGLLASLAAFTCGCDKQADDRVVKTPTAKVRVLVFTRPPDDPDYRKTVSLSATSGNAKGARERLVYEAEKQRCVAVLIKEEWDEEAPGSPGQKRSAVTADCLVK